MTETVTSQGAGLSVVLCSLNGAEGVRRCLTSLRRQTVAEQLEVIVVDDGSKDSTSEVAKSFGVTVLRHESNRGLAAARNTGVRAATAPVVAFLDDDCEAAPDWAENLLVAYETAEDEVIGIGGPIQVEAPKGYMRGFLTRHNPLLPLELDLAQSSGAIYRLGRYVVRNWRAGEPPDRRSVFSLVGANMSARTGPLAKLEFDESMTFGSEDLDMCIRLRDTYGQRALLFVPDVEVAHHFRAGIRDTLRRSRSYGRGHSRMLRKYPDMSPTVFPLPILSVALVAMGLRDRRLLLAAAVLPHLVHPQGLRSAVGGRPAALLDAYVSGLQEASFLVGAFGPASWARNRAMDSTTEGRT